LDPGAVDIKLLVVGHGVLARNTRYRV
jgi:hypothetical protein